MLCTCSVRETKKGEIPAVTHADGTARIQLVDSRKLTLYIKENGGKPFSAEIVQKAAPDLEELCHVLEGEGVNVRRPEIIDCSQPYKTSDFEASGQYGAMPRDLLLVVGNEIIEAPMAWRSRFFEYPPYRTLLKEYFWHGAKWTAAPKPLRSDNLYDESYPTCSESMNASRKLAITLNGSRKTTT